MDLSHIKLFAFDFDGTLVHSNHIKRRAFYDVVRAFATDADKAIEGLEGIFRHYPEYNRYQIFSALNEGYSELDPQLLAKAYTEQCKRLILEAEEVSGAYRFLSALKSLGAIAIINTATPKEAMDDIIPHLRFGNFINDIYGAPISKADNLKSAAQKYGINAKKIMMIGDRENDRAAAEDYGCSFIGIRSDLSDYQMAPTFLFDTLEPLAFKLS
ncbi:MAG: HAD family hydrolase [Micavibrio sp.]|nr:HAD family hydrolase [Micavibrio sp.]